ncbi:VWA domain-containing protein [Blastococcus sp. SYSU D00820]
MLAAAAAAVLLVVGGVVWWIAGSGSSGGCADPQVVRVTVAPELGPLADRLLSEPQGLGDGACAQAEVVAQEPLQTVGDLGALEESAQPHIWVPDSSLWAGRVTDVSLDDSGSMASSPLVLATSQAAVGTLGWDEEAPSWGEALATGRPIAVPDLATSAEGILALAAVRSALGGDEDADNAVVQAVLAASRGAVPSAADALTAGAEGGEDAPLVPVTEQEVHAVNAGSEQAALVAVYPAEGSPSLDYPVLRVGSPSDEERPAVDAVVRAMTAQAARDAVLESGFRDAEGNPPPDAGEGTGIRAEAPEELELDADDVQALLARLSSLAVPSRLLTVFDVSVSMEASVGGGNTRATLARDAARSALTLIPDSSAIGLWVFAYQLEGEQDWTELAPIRTLDEDVDGQTQRELLFDELDTIPGRLSPGGTALYDTTLAAVRAAQASYDEDAVNSVVVVTDGTNDDDAGLELEALLQTLRAEADPDRPVKVIGIALGPDADLAALEQIGEATGGAAYSAVDPGDLQTVLFDAIRQRG